LAVPNALRKRIERVARNEFARNVITMFSGNAIAYTITLASIPILSRIYTPQEFGLVALMVSIINVVSVAASGRYDMAIVLPKRSGQAFHLLVASLCIVLVVSILSIAGIWTFRDSVNGYFAEDSYRRIIWLIPLGVFLAGAQKCLYYWFNRNKEYKVLSYNRVWQNSTQVGVRLSRSLFTNGHWGLSTGYIAGLFAGFIALSVRLLRKESWRLRHLSLRTAFQSTKEHRNFPLYLLPMGILNAFSVNLLVFALTTIASSTIVGHYERASRVVNFPLSLISMSFSSVFYEKMSRAASRQRIYLFSYLGNLALASILLSPVLFWGEAIFGFILGAEWRIAGRIAGVILPLTIFGFAAECVSSTFAVVKKNQLLLIWQVAYLVVVLGWIFYAKGLDVFVVIRVFAILGAIMYLALGVAGYRSLAPKNK
jgi:O-antigen/teichoic acid export membrane protein